MNHCLFISIVRVLTVLTFISRNVESTGTYLITTILGTGYSGSGAGGLAATSTALNRPVTVYQDTNGAVYVADQWNSVIRRVVGGIATIYAGTLNVHSYTGDGGPASSASFNNPRGLCGNNAGLIYVTDAANRRIRVISATGIITTIVGTGVQGYSGRDTCFANVSMNR
jgi:hypothetical protein